MGVVAIGVVALGIAALEYFVLAGITPPRAGAGAMLGMSPGTAAYVMGYGGAGIVLIALGIVKIHRARRGR